MYTKVIAVSNGIKAATREDIENLKFLVENVYTTLGQVSGKLNAMLETEPDAIAIEPSNSINIGNNRHLSISINRWEDLFCKFENDTYSFGQKTLSLELIDALKNRYFVSKGQIDLNTIVIYAPKKLEKNKSVEQTVINAVKASLAHKYKARSRFIKKELAYRFAIIFGGGGLITTGGILGFSSGSVASIIGVVGGLGIWQGLNGIVDNIKKYSNDTYILKKLSRAQITVIYR